MRVVSWTVNGIRAGVRHGFVDFVDRSAADIVGVQQVRARPEDIRTGFRPLPGRGLDIDLSQRRRIEAEHRLTIPCLRRA